MTDPDAITLEDIAGEIGNAIRRYEDRKMALYNSRHDRPGINDDAMRRLLVGLDLDIEELNAARQLSVMASNTVLARTVDELGDPALALAHTMAGGWVDGLVTGILLMEARRNES